MFSPGGCERCGDNDHREERGDQAGDLHHVQDCQVQHPQAEPEQHESQLQGCQDCQTKKGWGHRGVRMEFEDEWWMNEDVDNGLPLKYNLWSLMKSYYIFRYFRSFYYDRRSEHSRNRNKIR